MNKKLLTLVLALVTLFMLGCEPNIGGKKNDDPVTGEGDSNIPLETGGVIFKGKVTSIDSNEYIEMEIVDSDIAFGIYWVLVSDVTEYYDLEGNTINRRDIKAGDTIEVVFGGQVMNSYPPKIAAKRIYVH